MSMTLKTFIATWTEKPCDFDKGGTFECVDLVRQYCVDVLKLPGYTLHALGKWGGAKDLYNKFTETKYFTRIANNPHSYNMPNPGAIVVWKGWAWSLKEGWVTGWAGHAAAVVQATGMKLIVFNQNYPKGSLPHLQSFTYTGVLGWIQKI